MPIKTLLSLLLKPACSLCSRSSPTVFCCDCERQLQSYQFDRPAQDWRGELPIFAWGKYDGRLKRSIAALKYDAKPQIADPLGRWLGEAWQQFTPTGQRPLVVPIPLHADRQRQRGYNQAALLAESFCQVTRLPIAPQGLLRIRSTEAQFGLTVRDRTQNLADAFALSPALARRRPPQVLLLDDIYTTGATVQAAARCFQRQGILVSGVVVLSRPTRHSSAENSQDKCPKQRF